MKGKILALLKKSDEYVSGEWLSKEMGVSRTAIWKHINYLRQEGYKIESVPRLGYKILHIPDKLYAEEIYSLLTTNFIGKKIYHYNHLTSTNDQLKKLADEGKGEGTVVVAEQQTAGKGRLGRSWFSPPGAGIWCSVLLRPTVSPAHAPKLTLLGAVAVAEGIEKYTGLQPGIKWPNDLLVEGKKVCGLLTEMRAEVDSINYVTLGFGINIKLVDFPEEVKGKAITLEGVLGKKLNRVGLLACILNAFEKNYLLFLSKGFSPIRGKWEELNVTLGKMVTVTSHSGTVSGEAVALGDGGGLVVRTDGDELKEFLSGEVTLSR
ncbi:biotin--[acetyl-CoA-carboxylase] ligase [Metallumcola ferriviriculae]|uniref:Bifunctional ligase/repressor BirA n=1 Tax=Metallumcola ferriviriculae TaxID=3039180 RepID=A0AAU0UJU1_9FIRM|nr:biotin--[acetyl-CoA-carboxylase] ligase [Desulfitibacteraceae bacterium MK1]